jgi:hypothetical protein
MCKGKMSDKLASNLPTGDVDVNDAETLRVLQKDLDAAEKVSQEEGDAKLAEKLEAEEKRNAEAAKQKDTLKVGFATPEGKPKLGPSWSKKSAGTSYTVTPADQRTLDALNHDSVFEQVIYIII